MGTGLWGHGFQAHVQAGSWGTMGVCVLWGQVLNPTGVWG